MSEKLKYQIAINLIPGVGPITAKKLIAYCGGVEAVFKEKKRSLLKVPNIGELTAKSVSNKEIFNTVDKEIDFITKYKINTYFYLDKNYPQKLKVLEDSPVLFFTKGNLDLSENRKMLSIVGTRSATSYGKIKCKEIVKDISDINPVIVSGLAYGIDAVAHKSALENNLKTAAVLGHGLNRMYPPTHRSLAEKISESGLLITEFLSDAKPDRENFPRRNRIIAGLSDAVLVVEAARKGGALITAYFANDYNRDVFAIPGKTNDKYSKGCNHLIKTHKAHLAESALDIKYIMRWENKPKKQSIQRNIFKELTSEQECIVNILKENNQYSIDLIAAKSNMTFSKVTTILLELELNGIVKTLPGKCYQIID